MEIEVYESDAEALDAAAALAETTLAASTSPHPTVGLAGGRGGRAIMLALSACGRLPWARTRFCVVDEHCVARVGEPSNRELLRDHLLGPRELAPREERPDSGGDGEARATAWETEVHATAGPDLTFDLLVLDLGARGELGVLAPESFAPCDPPAAIVRVMAPGASTVARVGLGAATLTRARRVIVVAIGSERSHALAAAVAPAGAPLPAHVVLPSERVTWFVDRAAAAELLRTAEPARA